MGIGCTKDSHPYSWARLGSEIHHLNGIPPLLRSDIESSLSVMPVERNNEEEKKGGRESGLVVQKSLGYMLWDCLESPVGCWLSHVMLV